MNITLMINHSDIRKVSKTLTEIKTVNAEIYETCDIMSPRLLLSYDNMLINCNYFYIPAWGKYYFIDTIDVSPAGKMILTGHTDVLMTYRDYILALQCTVSRQENAALSLIPDNNIIFKNDTIKNIYSSETTFTTMYGAYILQVLGGN